MAASSPTSLDVLEPVLARPSLSDSSSPVQVTPAISVSNAGQLAKGKPVSISKIRAAAGGLRFRVKMSINGFESTRAVTGDCTRIRFHLVNDFTEEDETGIAPEFVIIMKDDKKPWDSGAASSGNQSLVLLTKGFPEDRTGRILYGQNPIDESQHDMCLLHAKVDGLSGNAQGVSENLGSGVSAFVTFSDVGFYWVFVGVMKVSPGEGHADGAIPGERGIVARFPIRVCSGDVETHDWSDECSWVNGIPTADNDVFIPEGVKMVLNETEIPPLRSIFLRGTLQVPDGSDNSLHSLAVGSLAVHPMGELSIGSAEKTFTKDLLIKLTSNEPFGCGTGTEQVGHEEGELIRLEHGVFAIALGSRVRIYGVVPAPAHTKLVHNASAGAREIVVSDKALEGWRPGSQAAIIDATNGLAKKGGTYEIVVLASVSTGSALPLSSAEGSVLSFDNGLVFDYSQGAAVVILSRNVVISGRGADGPGFPGRLVIRAAVTDKRNGGGTISGPVTLQEEGRDMLERELPGNRDEQAYIGQHRVTGGLYASGGGFRVGERDGRAEWNAVLSSIALALSSDLSVTKGKPNGEKTSARAKVASKVHGAGPEGKARWLGQAFADTEDRERGRKLWKGHGDGGLGSGRLLHAGEISEFDANWTVASHWGPKLAIAGDGRRELYLAPMSKQEQEKRAIWIQGVEFRGLQGIGADEEGDKFALYLEGASADTDNLRHGEDNLVHGVGHEVRIVGCSVHGGNSRCLGIDADVAAATTFHVENVTCFEPRGHGFVVKLRDEREAGMRDDDMGGLGTSGDQLGGEGAQAAEESSRGRSNAVNKPVALFRWNAAIGMKSMGAEMAGNSLQDFVPVGFYAVCMRKQDNLDGFVAGAVVEFHKNWALGSEGYGIVWDESCGNRTIRRNGVVGNQVADILRIPFLHDAQSGRSPILLDPGHVLDNSLLTNTDILPSVTPLFPGDSTFVRQSIPPGEMGISYFSFFIPSTAIDTTVYFKYVDGVGDHVQLLLNVWGSLPCSPGLSFCIANPAKRVIPMADFVKDVDLLSVDEITEWPHPLYSTGKWVLGIIGDGDLVFEVGVNITAELRKWEEEDAARRQAIQRQLAEAGAARQQATAEAAAAARLQQRQTEASQNQVRYQDTMEPANEESTYRRLLRQQHFQTNEEQEEPTEEERSKEAIAVLMENMLYTCNWQQRELMDMRQIFIRYEGTFRTLDQKIAALQAENSTLQAANSHQQTINDQLQTKVSTGLARLSAVELTASAVSDCSPALAAQAKQLEERINHVVASLGDVSKFVGTSTVSNQLQTLSDRVQQRTDAVVKEWKIPNFKIEKFDDYHKTDPPQWWMAFNAEADGHHVPPLRWLDALYLQLIKGAQAFMTHMVVTLECTIATLHTKISWEDFEKKWKTRFMVNNDKRHALNKIFRMFQGQQPSREWLTEWQTLVATPELNLPFDSIPAEFFARSCNALTAALGSEFQYETFDEMIAKARELIQGNWRATNEARQQPGYVEKGKVPPPSTDDKVAVVDLRSYLAKIDCEHTTQRYVDIDAPLLYIRIQIEKATCSALINCRATRNYISQGFMARIGLAPRVRRKSQPMHVMLVDGHTQKSIDRCVDSVPVYFAPLPCEAMSFDILDTKSDMILGISWLQSEDHPVNFFRRTVHVRDRCGELVPCTVSVPRPSIGCHVVSAASIRQSISRHDIEEIGMCFLHALQPGDQPKMDTSDPHIIELLDNYEDVFQAPARVVPDWTIRHGITLKDGAVPPRGCIYRMSEEELQVFRAQLDDLLAKGWIRPSCSPYGAPVLFVQKKNKDLRLCIDYPKLQRQTIKNISPLPRIDDLLERLGGAKYFSKLDLKSGYTQIEIQPRDQYKTVFKTRYGHFEWTVMPFGLTNAPTTFQAAMTTEFRDLLNRTILIYLDDILVYSWSWDKHLRAVLERLRIAKYKANCDKCEFAQQELEYLGHYVTPQGIRPLADKVQVIQDWSDLACTTDIRSFLGLASY
ncbi:hypothetical protein CBR_g37942 [Chara braunii]|uniref:Reverse transcriptase domain-containing protein n=1 Tax=Chara braunii TaxID=69332 RepID=A0A388LP07_CHABU|nr:hypothetical protein CBR_g37942 [Chara braunii]|eukprot:GBG84067.1 hypothetical protein CBR_g37942 [Chara braunii]